MAAKLELYKVFREVARCGSISEAAKRLYLTQSAVSQSIKQLEQQLTSPLFLRMAKGVELTREGEMLRIYAEQALDLLEAGEKQLDAIRNLEVGDLKIAASDTISRYLLLPRLDLFHRLQPGVKLKIINRTTLESVELLRSGKADLAYLNLPLPDLPFNITELTIAPDLDIQDIFVGSPQIAAYREHQYTLEELSRLPLILLESKSNSRQYVDTFFQSRGISVTPEIELGSHDLLLEFAKIHLGVSCVIREFSQQCLESGELVELQCTKPIPQRKIGVAFLSAVPLSSAARRFLELSGTALIGSVKSNQEERDQETIRDNRKNVPFLKDGKVFSCRQIRKGCL